MKLQAKCVIGSVIMQCIRVVRPLLQKHCTQTMKFVYLTVFLSLVALTTSEAEKDEEVKTRCLLTMLAAAKVAKLAGQQIQYEYYEQPVDFIQPPIQYYDQYYGQQFYDTQYEVIYLTEEEFYQMYGFPANSGSYTIYENFDQFNNQPVYYYDRKLSNGQVEKRVIPKNDYNELSRRNNILRNSKYDEKTKRVAVKKDLVPEREQPKQPIRIEQPRPVNMIEQPRQVTMIEQPRQVVRVEQARPVFIQKVAVRK